MNVASGHLPRSALGPCRCRSLVGSVAPSPRYVARPSAATPSPDAVLEWVSEGIYPLKVSVKDLGAVRGKGLVAEEDIEPGEAILNIPFDKLLMSQTSQEADIHWSAEMAMRLLQQKCSTGTPSFHLPWIQSLPHHISTPLEYDAETVACTGSESMIREVELMRECVQSCYEALEPELQALGCSWTDFLWAVQVFHSRCFYIPDMDRHLAVPAVDMVNHSFAPNAAVQIQHGEDSCQGLAAVEEVCVPSALSEVQQESKFLLVAGPEGISEGEEVTICYAGLSPNEVYYLLFGFIASEPNPHDLVVLFDDATDYLSAYADASGDASILQQSELVEVDGLDMLIVTADGFDGRMGQVHGFVEDFVSQQQMGKQEDASSILSDESGHVNLAQVLKRRCETKLALLQTVADHAMLDRQKSSSPDFQASDAFRGGKQNILQRALEALPK